MKTQSVYLIRCPYLKCPDFTVLPRQILPDKFGGVLHSSEAIWPITYLCQICGRTFAVPVESIRLEDVETEGHSPLVWYEFSNGRTDSPVRFSIYSKELDPWHLKNPSWDRAVETVLKPSGLWLDTYGELAYVNVDSRLDGNVKCLY